MTEIQNEVRESIPFSPHKAEIYGCDTGSCGENTVDVGNVSHICTSDLMLCIRRSAKVYKTGNEYNRLNFTGHTRS